MMFIFIAFTRLRSRNVWKLKNAEGKSIQAFFFFFFFSQDERMVMVRIFHGIDSQAHKEWGQITGHQRNQARRA